jgi:hypothetical protein
MSEDLIYLVEITAYDDTIAGTRVLRYASGRGKMTRPSETPANAWYEPRLLQPIGFKRTMFSAARVTGGASVGAGLIVLNNTDQGLASLRDLGIDGRDVVVRIGPQDAAYPAGYTTILTGTAEQVEVGATTATIRLRDRLEILQQPLQANVYAGNNVLPSGAEGTLEDIKDQRKPLAFGIRHHFEPVLVNTSLLIYQVHDGSMQNINPVFDRRFRLTLIPLPNDFPDLASLEAATIPAGQYANCKALGLFRLGSSPDGQVTVLSRGCNDPTYVTTAADIIRRILIKYCGFTSADLDEASFTALAAAAPQDVGECFVGDVTRQQAIDVFLGSIGGWLVPTRLGIWQVGRLEAPTGTPVYTFGDPEIISLDTRATRDTGAGIPVWKVRMRGRRYAAATAADIVGAATESERAEFAQEWRETVVSDPAVRTKHLLAPEMQVDTAFAVTPMTTEATRVLNLHKVRRDFVQARVALTQAAAAVDLGSVVRLVTPRLGYGAGRDFVVVGIEADGKRRQLTLDLWG